jgi:hypothetical protein
MDQGPLRELLDEGWRPEKVLASDGQENGTPVPPDPECGVSSFTKIPDRRRQATQFAEKNLELAADRG